MLWQYSVHTRNSVVSDYCPTNHNLNPRSWVYVLWKTQFYISRSPLTQQVLITQIVFSEPAPTGEIWIWSDSNFWLSSRTVGVGGVVFDVLESWIYQAGWNNIEYFCTARHVWLSAVRVSLCLWESLSGQCSDHSSRDLIWEKRELDQAIALTGVVE